ncbi:pentapeptide repeat-containing protein [Nocardioides carbamazepini]|uniref:pentapeptide repeat-containing protein n=1 Tax=Nocardioides carbamazepini TaxID=2854259 RepID=UPI002149C7C0|nr:pentapeptide repeat-containing protein [Nocardioides carbamazepini]MCR1783169.1 pentapeptide repeat-containing protein [Nocardioides carbamazepini]
MKGPGAAELSRRWTPDRLAALQEQALQQARIVKGPHQFDTDWPRTDEGRLDLRGVKSGREGLQFRFITLSRADFRHARGRLMFFESELSDCLFDSVSLSGQPRFDRSFVRCSFRAASLKGLAIGTQVTACDFTGANLRTLRSLPNTRFERCIFDGADLSGADFSDTTFTDCTFVDATFSAGTSFTRCAFSNTSVAFGLARVTRSSREGEPLPDQWDGEEQSEAALEAYAQRYAAAAAAGRADDPPLDPEGAR